MGVKITGMGDFMRKLDRLTENAKALGGEHSVPMAELFSPAFLAAHTTDRFRSFEEWIRASGLDVSSDDALSGPRWDAHVISTTDFDSMDEMKRGAAAEWAKAKLFK